MQTGKIKHGFHPRFSKEIERAYVCHGAPSHYGLKNEARQRFDNAYLLWKTVSARYEHEMQLIVTGDKSAHTRLVPLLRDMAQARREILITSQPWFEAKH